MEDGRDHRRLSIPSAYREVIPRDEELVAHCLTSPASLDGAESPRSRLHLRDRVFAGAAPTSPCSASRRCCLQCRGSPQSADRSATRDRKSTRLNSSHITISYAVFCLKKKKKKQ